MCEEFPGITPSQLMREWARLPVGFLERVLEARAYAATKGVCDAATDPTQWPSTPMTDLVKQITFDVAQKEIDQSDG